MEDYGFRLLDGLGVLKFENNEIRYAAELFVDDPRWDELIRRVKNNDPELAGIRDYILSVDAEIKKITPAVKQYLLAYLLNEFKAVEKKFTERESRFRNKCPVMMGIKALTRERVEIKDLQGKMRPPARPPVLLTKLRGSEQEVFNAEAHNIEVLNNWHKDEDELLRAFAVGGDTLINYMIEHDPEIGDW